MRRLVLVAVAVGGCFSTPPPPSFTPPPDGPVVTGGYRRTITINDPPSPALSRFPVSVVLTADAGLLAHASSRGHITFASEGSEALPCEIVDYETGSLEAWVVLPELSATQHTFELVYGDEIVTTCDPTKAWPMDEYRGVWHLSDPQPGIALDASPYRHTLTSGTAGMPTSAPAMVGLGQRFVPAKLDGANDAECNIAATLDPQLASFSYELWVRQEMYQAEYDVALANGGKNDAVAGYDFELGLGDWDAYVRDATTFHRLTLTSDVASYENKWAHVAVSVDRDARTVTAYLDGLPRESNTLLVQSIASDQWFCLGDVTEPMLGTIDEVRVHAKARNDIWFATDVANVANRNTFMTIGDER